jgi:hypothetical protein
VIVESNGAQVQPLWSSRKRVVKIIKTVKGYEDCTILGIHWSEFENMWIDQLAKEGILLGVNWSGPNADGYEMAPHLVAQSVKAAQDAVA